MNTPAGAEFLRLGPLICPNGRPALPIIFSGTYGASRLLPAASSDTLPRWALYWVKSTRERMTPMKTRTLAAAIVMTLAAIVLPFAPGVPAQAPAVRVLASNGVQGALNDIIPKCEHAVGHPLAVEFGTTATLKPRIEGGEAFDFTVLTSEAIDALIKEGKIAADSRANVARVGIGIGIRAGSPKPDVSMPEALKKTLLNAKSITYAAAGASRPPTDKMLSAMGIADALKPKTFLLTGAEETSAALRDGKA